MADEIPEPSFDLDVTITDPALVEWLSELPADELAARVEGALRAGHFVLNLVQAAAGEEQMARYFRPVTERMDELNGTLRDIMERAQKSQRIGELGEEIVARQLRDSFPGDRFEVVSDQPGEADIKASFALDPFPETDARVEVKLYSRDVPTPELKKFRRDLKETGVRYGLMVSLTSRLAGVHGPMEVEDTGDYTAVYLPNAGLDGVNLVAATALLKALILYHARADAARRVPAGAVERAWERINAEIEDIKDIVRAVERFRGSVRTAETALTNHMNQLAEEATWIHARLHTAVHNLTGRLSDELAGLPTAGEPPALPAPSPPDAILAAIAGLEEARDKRTRAFRRLHEVAADHGVDIHLSEDGRWHFLRDGSELAHTESTKTRVDVVFPVPDDATVEVDQATEKLARGAITVDGKDPDALASRVAARFEQSQT